VGIFNKKSVSTVSDITRDHRLSSSNQKRSSNIHEETMQVQEEFDQLMKEMVTSKIAAEHDLSK
jgi:hypothetical protein